MARESANSEPAMRAGDAEENAMENAGGHTDLGNGPKARIVSAAGLLALALVAVAVLGTLAFALGTLRSRALDGSEGHILYDALRIRAGRVLYVDPHIGILDDGAPPARHYVIYTPLMAYLVALFPADPAFWLARLVSSAAWYGLLAWLAATAKRSGADRKLAWGTAAFVGGVYVLTLYGASGRPDALAVCVAGVAFARSVRAGRAGPLEGALFALAAWIKPNVLALAAGTLVVDLVRRRSSDPRGVTKTIAAAGAVSVAFATMLMLVSHGAFVQHLVEPLKAPMSLSLAWEQASSRLPFFGIAIVLAFIFAWRSRAASPERSYRALGGLTAAFFWTLFSLSKYGSASNYWMETMVAVVVVASSFPLADARFGAREPLVALGLVLFQIIWTGVGSVRSSIEGIALAPKLRAEIGRVREVCGARPGETVMADDSGLELMIDGRLFHAPVQLTPLVKYGRWSEAAFLEDVRRPEVTCAVMSSDLLEKPSTEIDPDHDLYNSTLREALRERFVLAEAADGLWIYALRSRSTGKIGYSDPR